MSNCIVLLYGLERDRTDGFRKSSREGYAKNKCSSCVPIVSESDSVVSNIPVGAVRTTERSPLHNGILYNNKKGGYW